MSSERAADGSRGWDDGELGIYLMRGPGAPRLTIDAELHVGGIDVQTEPTTRRSLS